MSTLALPAELIHYIFELVASSSIQGSLSLSLVCSWSRELCTPHLFRTSKIADNRDSSSAFCRSMALPVPTATGINRIPAGTRRASLVHSLWMPRLSRDVVSMFIACDNLQNLAVSAGGLMWLAHILERKSEWYPPPPEDVMSREGDLRITVIGELQHWGCFGVASWGARWYHRITHLQALDVWTYEYFPTQMFQLTHLAVSYLNPKQHSAQRLRRLFGTEGAPGLYPNLQAIAVVYDPDRVTEADASSLEGLVFELREQKLELRVSVLRSSVDNIAQDWEAQSRGAPDIWERAALYSATLKSQVAVWSFNSPNN